MLTRIKTRFDKGSRALKLCVIGLGYIGLPTAVMFAKCGLRVHGEGGGGGSVECAVEEGARGEIGRASCRERVL